MPAAGVPARGSSTRADDLSALRALTHPLRVRMLAHLRLHGAATASALGRVFGESSGATSYHLRQLERFGFVTSAGDQPSRRERQWRASAESTEFDSFAGDAATRSVTDRLVRHQLATLVDGIERRQREMADWPAQWQGAHLSDDYLVRITPERLRDLSAALQAVIQDFRMDDEPRAQPIAVHLHSYFPEGTGVPKDTDIPKDARP